MKRIFTLLLLVWAASAETVVQGTKYVYSKETALSAAAEVVTIQQPASSAKYVRFESAYIDSSVAVTITLERDGAGATSTAGTITAVNPSLAPTAAAKAWNTSNVGVGTVIAKYSIPANGAISLDLSDMIMSTTGITKNLTIRTSSITGTVHITVKWAEQVMPK